MNPDIDNLRMLFKKMEDEGWNTNANLKWGFFFVDSDREKLQAIYGELKDKDYTLESIYFSYDKKWTLHTSKIETLTIEKLQKRNFAFNDLSNYYNIDMYDGWDVGPI